MIAIVIPVKELSIAKSRLSPVLSDALRRGFVAAMLADVLRAVSEISLDTQVFVVSDDPQIAGQAENSGADVVKDAAEPGYNSAVGQGVKICRDQGIHSMLVLPADLPLISPTEIETVLSGAAPGKLVLAPARDGLGTNAMLLTPPNALDTEFGPDSFRRHQQKAAEAGLSVVVINEPGLSFDIDTPQDLEDLCKLEDSTESQRFLFDHGITGVITGATR